MLVACGSPSGSAFFGGCPHGGCVPFSATSAGTGGLVAQGGNSQGGDGQGGSSGGDAGGAQGGAGAGAGAGGGLAGAGGSAAGAGNAGFGGGGEGGGDSGASGTAGASGDAAGGNAGSAGDAGSSGAGGLSSCLPQVGANSLIYDGSEGACTLGLAPPRTGVWYAFDDGTTPQPSLVSPQAGGRGSGGSGCSIHDTGNGATDYGGGFSLVFNGTATAPCVYDASVYTGIHLYLRGSTTATQTANNMVRVNVVTTTTSDEFGTCTNACNDHYGVWCAVMNGNFTLCDVPFGNLSRRGFGSPADFSKAQVLFLQILAVRAPGAQGGTNWNLSADDVTFY
ncbi:MAG TPA: hypothetical protein VGM29_08955 [Polyangiaceae bacterium]